MALKYQRFFTIELTHDYFADKRCRGVNIVPDDATQNLFKNHRVRYKQVDNKIFFLIFSEGDDNTGVYTPFIPLLNNVVFRFAVQIDDYRFFNYTNLAGVSGKTKYVFKNDNVNIVSSPTRNLLSKPLTAYANTKFVAGQLCVQNVSGNKIYEATQTLVSAPTPSGSNSYQFVPTVLPANELSPAETVYPASTTNAFTNYPWYLKGDAASFAAASSNDVLPVANGFYLVALPSAVTSVNYSVKAFNPLTRAFDITPVPAQTLTFSLAVSEFKLPLNGLKTGRYLITVNGTDTELFVTSDDLYNNAPCVIEIYPSVTNNTYRLISGIGNLNNPTYTIQFTNKLVFWKYKARKLSGTDGEVTFSNILFRPLRQSSPTFDEQLLGVSYLQIPLSEKLSETNGVVYPQANAPPISELSLPLAQADSLSFIQLIPNGDKLLTSVNSVNI